MERTNMTKNDKTYIRRRMIEIFQDYAMDEDEEYVQIDMYFRKNNGEEQYKVLHWNAKAEPFDCDVRYPRLRGCNHYDACTLPCLWFSSCDNKAQRTIKLCRMRMRREINKWHSIR